MKKIGIAIFILLSARLGFCDSKISAMSSTTTLNSGDVIPVVTNPSGSAANFKITASNLSTAMNTLNPLSLIAGTNMTSITGSWPNFTFNAATQAGGGVASTLAVSTGSATTSVIVSSPTSNIVVDSNTFNLALQGSTSVFMTIKPSSVTLQGNTFNGASQLVQTNGSSQLPALSGVNLTALNASNLGSGTVPNARLDNTSVTLQANTFNGASQLVQMNGSTQLPAVSGVNLTALNATQLTSGSVPVARFPANELISPITMSFDGAGSALTTSTRCVVIPYSGTVSGWTIVADQTGSLTLTVQKSTYSGYPTTSNTCASDCPILSSVQKNQNLSSSTWGAITAGDVMCFGIASASSVTWANVVVQVNRN